MARTDPASTAAVVACPKCGRRNRVPAVASGHPTCAACHAPLPWMVEAGDNDFAAVVGGATPVLVDLWAPWCGPCRMVSPAVEQVGTRLAGRVKVVKVNVDQSPAVSARYGVQAIPTLLLLQGGEERSRQVGAVPVHTLQAWVEQTLDALTGPER